MTRRRVFASVVVPALLVASSVLASQSGDAWERFQRTKWSTVRSLSKIPTEVRTALRSHLGEDPRLADVGEPIDATDISTGLPTRRLVLAGSSASDWFIVYEQGGRGHHLVFVDFEMGAEPHPVLLATGSAGVHDDKLGWRLDLHGLTKGLKAGTMHWGDAGATSY